MLNELHIENIAVIERADISFAPGLNVLTGETGAGKSIVIDSIGAVLGDRVSRELVRRGAERAVVTASFDMTEEAERYLRDNEIEADDELVIQRRILSDGKSSCRICGIPVSAVQLKELASMLVDIHGQNDGRQLMDERRHLTYLDRFGNLEPDLAAYAAHYESYVSIKKEIAALRLDEEEKDRLRDRMSYRISELESAALKRGEFDELSARLGLLRNAEKLSEAIDNACSLLYDGEENAVSLAQNAEGYARRAASIAPELEQGAKSIHDAVFSLTDASEQLRDFRDSLDFSPEEYDRLETRLALLNKLQRKYNADEEALIAMLEESRQKLTEIDSADERIAELEKKLSAATEACRMQALSCKAATLLCRLASSASSAVFAVPMLARTCATSSPSAPGSSWPDSAAATAPQPRCPSTSTIGTCRCATAYSTLASAERLITLPALRMTNSSPTPTLNTCSTGTRESAQQTTAAKGVCPSSAVFMRMRSSR